MAQTLFPSKVPGGMCVVYAAAIRAGSEEMISGNGSSTFDNVTCISRSLFRYGSPGEYSRRPNILHDAGIARGWGG